MAGHSGDIDWILESSSRRGLVALAIFDLGQLRDSAQLFNLAVERSTMLATTLGMPHWTRSPAKALEIMVELNNKYALDGRDPDSYSGIFWCLGRYDRPWGPERPIFGTVRHMSSQNTARKFNVREFVQQYSSSYEGVTPAK